MDPLGIGMLAALGSAASWAVGSVLFEQVGKHLSSSAMTLTKGFISAVILLITLIVTGYTDMSSQDLLLLILSGLLGISLADTFFFEALNELGAHATVLLSTLCEVFTIFWAVLILQEKPSLLAWGGIILVPIGIAVVILPQVSGNNTDSSSENEGYSLRGLWFGLLSVLCMSFSIIIAKIALDNISAIQATFIRMLAGTVGILAFGLATKNITRWILPLKQPRLLGFFFFSILIITFGGFWLSLVGIKYAPVSIAQTLNTTDPVFALFLAPVLTPLVISFLEKKPLKLTYSPISVRALWGTVITLSGVALIFFAK